MKNFKGLKVWQKGFDIAVASFKLTESFPTQERFGLSSQITRAAVSIPSNIAEGSSRSSEKDYKRFLEIALGSGFELETHLLIAEKACYGPKEVRDQMLKEVDEEQKMLIAFIKKLEN
ncbi:MAG: four helix bundle protein [Sediminibacterium sp.]|nr:four helix bundle protein [Sediminibacterium sp.]